MFWPFFKRKKDPKNALEAIIFEIYGNPPPPKRANVALALVEATALLNDVVEERELCLSIAELNNSAIPYTTEELALSASMKYFKDATYIPELRLAQLLARLKMAAWLKDGRVSPIIAKSFEETLYKIYKP